jgi:ankyrin repeat protein
MTDIHDAARRGDVEVVAALLKDNPDQVFSKNSDGDTPLHKALAARPLAADGNKDVVELLLANKADVNAKNVFG